MTQTMNRTTPQPTNAPQDDQPKYIISDSDRKRVKEIQAAWKAYDGDFTKPLLPMEDQADDNVIVNRCKQIVETGVSFLFGKELEISAEEGVAQEVQDFIDEVWGDKEVRIPLLMELGMNGAMARNAFLRIVPGDDGTFALIAIDPSTVFIQTAPGNCKAVMMYCIQYACAEPDPRTGRPINMYYREEITRIDPDGNSSKGLPDDDDTWQVQHWMQRTEMNMEPRNTGWIPAGTPYIWPYSFAPMFMCQNFPRPNEAWGTADITPDLIGKNDSLNMTESNTQRVLRIYGNPHVWAKNVADQDIGGRPGHVTILGSEGEMGAIQFTSDVPSALSFSANLRSDMDEHSGVPAIATGRLQQLPRGDISGTALELMFMPVLKRTDTKRCTYGKMILDVTKALLVLNHMSPDIDITLQWQSPLPTNALQNVQAALLKEQAGVSKRTTLEELGYNFDDEVARNQEEDQQAVQQAQSLGFPPANQQPMQPGQPGQPGMMQQQQGQQQQHGQSPFLGR